jgi:hypothetical protein
VTKKKSPPKAKKKLVVDGPDMKDPAVRALLREEKKKANQARHAKLQAQMMAEHKAFIEASQPPVPVEVDWSTRPKIYTPELGRAVCNRIATSSRSMGRMCREEGMPALHTIFEWFDTQPEFLQSYARAREMQADYLAEECLDIADEQHIGEKTTTSMKEGLKITREDMLGHRNLRIDTRKWFAAKMRPRKYGLTKVEVAGDPDHPLGAGFDADSLDDAALAKIVAKVAAANAKKAEA